MGRRMVRDILRAERERGATVFLNSHLLGEIEVTCDRVAFIKDGQVVAEKELGTGQPDTRVMVRAGNLSSDTVAGLARWTDTPQWEAEQLSFGVRDPRALPEILRHLVGAGADVYSFTPERQPLEELFVKVMGEDSGL
jgi:ABC-2 type transport system ATP-binding protein